MLEHNPRMRQFDRSQPIAPLQAREAVLSKFSLSLKKESLSPISEARYSGITECFGYGELELLYELLDELVDKLDEEQTPPGN